MLVLTPKITNRLRFTFNLLLGDLLGVEPVFTVSKEEFLSFDGPKLSYGITLNDDHLFFASNRLLFENGISACEINYFDFQGTKAFFQVYQSFLGLYRLS